MASEGDARTRYLKIALVAISFTIWSSLVHGGVMAVQAAMNPHHHIGHLYGDVPALFLVAIVLFVLRPRQS